jgi:hypothetical protein
MTQDDQENIELMLVHTEDGKEVVISIKKIDGTKLTLNDVILELEYYINQLSQVDEALAKPGVIIH